MDEEAVAPLLRDQSRVGPEKTTDEEQQRNDASDSREVQLEEQKGDFFHENKDEDSSELSDLGEADSEAETEKMYFLESEGLYDGELDLQALSKLSEQAKSEQQQRDSAEEEQKLGEQIGEHTNLEKDDPSRNKNENEKQPEDTNRPDEMEEHKKGEKRKSSEESLPRWKLYKKENDEQTEVKSENEDEDLEDNKDIEESEVIDERDSEDRANLGRSKNKHRLHRKSRNRSLPVESVKETNENDEVSESESEEKQEEKESDAEKENDREALEEDHESDSENRRYLDDEVDINKERKRAIDDLINIEDMFADLRDKLFQNKLHLLEHELLLCLEGSHPELSKIYYKINNFHQDCIRQANANLNYKLNCIDTETIASRTSIHQNFLRQLMDSKNDMINGITSSWYKINKERNQLDQLVPDYSYVAVPSIRGDFSSLATPHDPHDHPTSKKVAKQNTLIELVRNRSGLNEEIGILNSLLHYQGLPAAVPSAFVDNENVPIQSLVTRLASEEEINDDLAAMGIPIP